MLSCPVLSPKEIGEKQASSQAVPLEKALNGILPSVGGIPDRAEQSALHGGAVLIKNVKTEHELMRMNEPLGGMQFWVHTIIGITKRLRSY